MAKANLSNPVSIQTTKPRHNAQAVQKVSTNQVDLARLKNTKHVL